MALSEALSKMSTQAKEAEEHFQAARGAQRAKVEEEVSRVRTSTEKRRGALQSRADDGKAEISSKWRDLHEHWEGQVKKVRSNIDEKRDEHDAKRAAHHADNAEADAEFAAYIAQCAIEEAEYAALEAVLARSKADELAAAR